MVTLVNDPGLQDSTIFRGKILTYYGRWTYKIEEARRQGAAGILMVHTTESATYPWTTVLSGWTGPQVRLETPPELAVVAAGWLQQETAARLFQAGGQDLARAHRGGRGPARLQGGARWACSVEWLGAERHPPHRDRQRPRPPPRAAGPCRAKRC